MKTLTAVITTYNRADFIDRCVTSITMVARADLFIRVVVFDNGSVDETPEILARVIADAPAHAVIETRRTEDNRPIVHVLNRGLDVAFEGNPVDYIVVLNDDTEFLPGALEELIAACDANPDSILTPLQINYRDPERVDESALGHIQKTRDLVEDAVMGRELKQVYDLPTIIGACMFARREVWESVGKFDTLFWFYGLDDDLCTRARFQGYRTLLAAKSHLHHAHGKIGVSPQTQAPKALFRKWRNETQARFLFQLKKPHVPLTRAFLKQFLYAVQSSAQCLIYLWPKGALHIWLIYLDLLRNASRISEARKDHFDPAKRNSASTRKR